MKIALLLFVCLAAMVCFESSDAWGRWRVRVRVRLIGTRFCRRRVARWLRVCRYSAGKDTVGASQNLEDPKDILGKDEACNIWFNKEKPGQCDSVTAEMCMANCTGCNASGRNCPDKDQKCDDCCCVCGEAEYMKAIVDDTEDTEKAEDGKDPGDGADNDDMHDDEKVGKAAMQP